MPKLSAKLSLKVTPELKAALKKRAAELERTVNWLAGKYLERGLNEDRADQRGSKK